MRKLIHALFYVVFAIMKPFKIYAYRTRFGIIRSIILEITTFIDWLSIFFNIQNNSMMLNWKVFKGNFIFGKAVMVVDYDSAAEALPKPLMKGNNFMGVNIVSASNNAFALNSGSLNQNPPLRDYFREGIDKTIFTESVRALDIDKVREQTQEIVEEWGKDPKMTHMYPLRSAATRIFFKILADTTISYEDSLSVTQNYIRRFGELSMFNGYVPWVNGLLGTRKHVRKDAYYILKNKYNIDVGTIDMTLFAAMFSIGTLVIQAVDFIQENNIDYKNLDYQHKRNFIYEAVRLWPTVTSVHRMLEDDEVVRVGNKDLNLTVGDEIDYPFICTNRDPKHFSNPDKMDLDRPAEEYEKVLSWSKGPHGCPGKEISILVSIVMLDAMAEHTDLSTLKIFNITF